MNLIEQNHVFTDQGIWGDFRDSEIVFGEKELVDKLLYVLENRKCVESRLNYISPFNAGCETNKEEIKKRFPDAEFKPWTFKPLSLDSFKDEKGNPDDGLIATWFQPKLAPATEGVNWMHLSIDRTEENAVIKLCMMLSWPDDHDASTLASTDPLAQTLKEYFTKKIEFEYNILKGIETREIVDNADDVSITFVQEEVDSLSEEYLIEDPDAWCKKYLPEDFNAFKDSFRLFAAESCGWKKNPTAGKLVVKGGNGEWESSFILGKDGNLYSEAAIQNILLKKMGIWFIRHGY